MIRLLLFLLIPAAAYAQGPQVVVVAPPTAEEVAFARLPADLRQMLGHMPAAQAMRAIAQAGQQSIALGNPQPSPEQFRSTLGAVLGSSYYTGASAGATSFPPLSPLVAPPPPPFLR